jgi:hypothetical protein
MGCAPSHPVDLATEVNLYHFDLHRVVGKGAFGKVRRPSYLLVSLTDTPFVSIGPRRRTQKEQKALCSQVHRQATVHQTEGGCQRDSGKTITRRGAIQFGMHAFCQCFTFEI